MPLPPPTHVPCAPRPPPHPTPPPTCPPAYPPAQVPAAGPHRALQEGGAAHRGGGGLPPRAAARVPGGHGRLRRVGGAWKQKMPSRFQPCAPPQPPTPPPPGLPYAKCRTSPRTSSRTPARLAPPTSPPPSPAWARWPRPRPRPFLDQVDADPRVIIEGHEDDLDELAPHPAMPHIFATACKSGKAGPGPGPARSRPGIHVHARCRARSRA